MTVEVDQELCMGCGMCENICPAGFGMKDGKAYVKDGTADCVDEVISSCPASAVTKG